MAHRTRSSGAQATDPCTAFGMVAPRTWDRTRRVDKMAERLARQIIDDILDQGAQPGTRLGSEAQLSAVYGVGRATLREALRLLEVQGFVIPKRGPGGGLAVGEATSRDFARMAKLHLQARGATYGEVLAARLAIEPMLARVATEAVDERGREELRAVMAEAARIEPSDEAGFIANASRFHVVVARMSGNTLLDLIGTIVQEMHEARPSVPTSPPRRTRAVTSHSAIADAIFAGDAAEAERLMREHVLDSSLAYRESGRADERIRWT